MRAGHIAPPPQPDRQQRGGVVPGAHKHHPARHHRPRNDRIALIPTPPKLLARLGMIGPDTVAPGANHLRRPLHLHRQGSAVRMPTIPRPPPLDLSRIGREPHRKLRGINPRLHLLVIKRPGEAIAHHHQGPATQHRRAPVPMVLVIGQYPLPQHLPRRVETRGPLRAKVHIDPPLRHDRRGRRVAVLSMNRRGPVQVEHLDVLHQLSRRRVKCQDAQVLPRIGRRGQPDQPLRNHRRRPPRPGHLDLPLHPLGFRPLPRQRSRRKHPQPVRTPKLRPVSRQSHGSDPLLSRTGRPPRQPFSTPQQAQPQHRGQRDRLPLHHRHRMPSRTSQRL